MMIDIQELELEFKAYFGDKENEHTLLARMFPLIAEVKRLHEALSEIDEDFFSYLKDVRPNDSLTRILQEMKE